MSPGWVLFLVNSGLTVWVLKDEFRAALSGRMLDAHERWHLGVGIWHIGSHGVLVAAGLH